MLGPELRDDIEYMACGVLAPRGKIDIFLHQAVRPAYFASTSMRIPQECLDRSWTAIANTWVAALSRCWKPGPKWILSARSSSWLAGESVQLSEGRASEVASGECVEENISADPAAPLRKSVGQNC